MGAAGLPTQPSSQYIATYSEIKILIMTLRFGQCPFCIHKTSTVVLYTLIYFLNFCQQLLYEHWLYSIADGII